MQKSCSTFATEQKAKAILSSCHKLISGPIRKRLLRLINLKSLLRIIENMSWFLRWRLSTSDFELIGKLSDGYLLKSHRNIEGQKRYALYSPDGEETERSWRQVQKLLKLKIITTNQKFPAATFLLTNLGQSLAKGKKARGVGSIVKFDS